LYASDWEALVISVGKLILQENMSVSSSKFLKSINMDQIIIIDKNFHNEIGEFSQKFQRCDR